jgi:hypothetical protein
MIHPPYIEAQQHLPRSSIRLGVILLTSVSVETRMAVSALSLPVRLARPSEARVVSELVNTAFVEGDSFFKKPAYFKRLDDDGEQVRAVIEGVDADFLVVHGELERPEGTEGQTEGSGESVPPLLGCVKVEYPTAGGQGREDAAKTVSFGMMSVPTHNAGKGVGTTLLRGLEAHFSEKYAGRAVVIEMPLISVRPDLFEWYGKRGYAPRGAPEALPDDLRPMLSDEYDDKVHFQFFTKTLVTEP